jgi:putative membrane protein
MKLLIHWIIYIVAIAVTAYLLPGVHVSGIAALVVFSIVLGAINVFLKPILVVLTLPLTVFTLGLFYFVLNALLVLLAAAIVPGFFIANFWWALLFALVLSIIHTVLRIAE